MKDRDTSQDQEMEKEKKKKEQVTSKKDSEKDDKKEGKKKLKEKISELEGEIQELKDKNLRLFAEFDNFRKRSSREKLEFAKSAGQDIINDLLPVLDDLDRAQKSIEGAKEIQALKDGFELIAGKLKHILENKGLKEMESIGMEFNAEIHEAITEVQAPSEEMKGKILDEVEKGYYLHDKIIRYPKVVVGK